MIVRELCPLYVASCAPEATLAAAAGLLWEHDCGILPVVDGDHRILGVLTDRDICMALATRDCPASLVLVKDVMTTPVHSVMFEDSAAQALRIMREHHVRRLPVTDGTGVLEGILSINNLVLAASEPKAFQPFSPNYREVMATLKSLCARPRLELRETPRQELIKA